MIIDSHIHTAWNDQMLSDDSKLTKIPFNKESLLLEMKKAGVVNALSIAFKSMNNNLDTSAPTPWVDDEKLPNIKFAASINPHLCTGKSLTDMKILAKNKKISAIKIYLGYFYKYATDKEYLPYYELAAKYKLPVIFHTGDTFSDKGKLKFSQPLQIDELAVDFPKTNFVIAHMGNPWLMDSAAVIYKNKNVYGDLSGFAIGRIDKNTIIDKKMILSALEYCEYKRIIYGSDWPLVRMDEYINLIRKLVPAKHHKKVFYETAKKLFSF